MRVIFSVLVFFVAFSIGHAQKKTTLVGHSLGDLKQLNQQEPNAHLFSLPSFYVKESTLPINNSSSTAPTAPLPYAYKYEDLAVFCKLEVKMEKVVKMPIKFRLGSVDYVDWLEGKRDWY